MNSPMRSSRTNDPSSSARPAETSPWRDLLRTARASLGDANEAFVLAEEAAHVSRTELVLALDTVPRASDRARFQALVERRSRGAPLQHVVGHWGFRRLDLFVDGRALVPRPETEFTVEVALAELTRRRSFGEPALVVELGTGSGAIACSLVAELDSVSVVATDCSVRALEVAGVNRARLARNQANRVEFRLGDWYAALDPSIAGRVDLVVANPPYIAASEWYDLDPVVRDFDPPEALVAGETGREAIEKILRGASAWLARDAAVVVEIAPNQAPGAVAFAFECGARDVEVRRDLAGRDRVVVVRW
ncbi:MAG TPA: peptide chain release factor N(5)-glutamine methyltransferase [Acidimicrobiales bacterium]|nr:peptide chain release factor N(5)-glutamine methyltransferase [Acidimicrobiales bacterium]